VGGGFTPVTGRPCRRLVRRLREQPFHRCGPRMCLARHRGRRVRSRFYCARWLVPTCRSKQRQGGNGPLGWRQPCQQVHDLRTLPFSPAHCRDSTFVKDSGTRRVRGKGRPKHESKRHPNKGVEPILPAEPTRRIDEVVELFVQGLRLHFRERVRFPHMFRQFIESSRNLLLLVRSERRIFSYFIGADSKQLGLTLKFCPQIRGFKVSLDFFKPRTDPWHQSLPATGAVWPNMTIPHHGLPDVMA